MSAAIRRVCSCCWACAASGPLSRAAEERDELGSSQVIELHFGSLPAKAGSQHIELAAISQQPG